MIEVEVRQEEMEPPDAAVDEVEAEVDDPGSRVEDKDGAVLEGDLHARRVPAERHGVGPRSRHRSAAAPDRQTRSRHRYSRQKIATMPTNSSA